MTKLATLQQQVAQLQARLDHYENHGTRLALPDNAPKANGTLTSRTDAWYLNNKPKLAARLCTMLANNYAELAFNDNLARGVTFDGASTVELGDLPKVMAATLTRESVTRQELASAIAGQQAYGADHNAGKVQRLKVELAARERHTLDLVRSTELPLMPVALLAKVKALGMAGHKVDDRLGGVIARPFDVEEPASLPRGPTAHPDQFADRQPSSQPSQSDLPPMPDYSKRPAHQDHFDDPDAVRRPGQRPRRIDSAGNIVKHGPERV